MGRTSRNKGKRSEREAAALIKRWGFDARRSRQYSGSPDSPDVVTTIPGVHIEVANRERHDVWGKMEQAQADGGDALPLLLLKRNGKPWLAVVLAEHVPAVASRLCPAPLCRGRSRPENELQCEVEVT